jgi:hypothetical protein
VDTRITTLSQNPIALAALYQEGLGKHWRNQTEAAKALARLHVAREDINRALRVAALPQSVLALFRSTGITNVAARKLISLQRAIGVAELDLRSRQIDVSGRSWQDVVDLLAGNEPKPERTRRRQLLETASEFTEGLANGDWSTMAEAARKTGWHAGQLSNAVAVAGMHPDVLELFENKRITKEVGTTLLSIQRSIGQRKLLENAHALRHSPKRRTTDELLNALAGVKPYTDIGVKVRGSASTISIEMTFGVNHAEHVLLDLDQMKIMLESIIANSARRRKRR